MSAHRNGDVSDDRLLELCRQGDRSAFSELWQRHCKPALAAAHRIAPSLDADDLVSGAYLKIYEMVLDGRGPRGAFRPYLYRVISSLAADAFRSPEQAHEDLDPVPGLHQAGPWEDRAFDLNAAARAFERLPERWQAVLWYSEVEGLPPREVAPLLGLTPNGVSALTARAREGLQSAWVEAHVDMQLAEERCRSTLERLQRFQRGKLTARASREVEAHLAECRSCSAAATEFTSLNRHLALALAAIVLGGSTAAAMAEALGLSLPAGAGATASASASAAGAASGPGSGGTVAAGSGTVAASSGAGALVLAVVAPLIAAAAIGGGVLLHSALTDDPAGGLPIASSEQTDSARTGTTPHESRTEDREGRDPGRTRPTDPPVISDEASSVDAPAALPQVEAPAGRSDAERRNEPATQKSDPERPGKKPDDGEEPGEPQLPVDDGDPGILPAEDFFYLSGAGMIGRASDYGVLRLRAVPQGGDPVEIVHPMYDPALEGTPGNVFTCGVFKDPNLDSNSDAGPDCDADPGAEPTFIIDFGFFTGTDPSPTNGWYADDPAPLLAAHGLSIEQVTLEVRLVTPDGRYSRWTPLHLG